jgi:hypothetical protein
VCERLWVSAPSTIIDFVHLHFAEWTPADTACLGRCHAPIKSRQSIPTGDERHSESQSGPRADSVNASQLAAGRSLSRWSDVTRNPNSKRETGRLR